MQSGSDRLYGFATGDGQNRTSVLHLKEGPAPAVRNALQNPEIA
jgi:hypothetical protein